MTHNSYYDNRADQNTESFIEVRTGDRSILLNVLIIADEKERVSRLSLELGKKGFGTEINYQSRVVTPAHFHSGVLSLLDLGTFKA